MTEVEKPPSSHKQMNASSSNVGGAMPSAMDSRRDSKQTGKSFASKLNTFYSEQLERESE